MSDRLTYKQRLFVEAYLGPAGGNATDAARRAGYAWPDRAGPRLVGKSSVRAAIDARLDEAALSTSEILARLSECATASVEHFIAIDENAQGDAAYRLDLNKAKRRHKLHLIKKIKPTQHGIGIELHDPIAALDKLGRYRGLWDSKGQGDDETVATFVKAVQQIATQGQEPIEPPGG